MQIQNNLTLTLFFRGFTLGFGNFLACPLCQNWQFTCFVHSSFHFGIGCSLWTVFLCAKGPSFFVIQSSLKLRRQKIYFQIGVLWWFAVCYGWHGCKIDVYKWGKAHYSHGYGTSEWVRRWLKGKEQFCMSPLWQRAVFILGIWSVILCVCYPGICPWSRMLWRSLHMLLQCCLTDKVNVYGHFNSNTLFWFGGVLQLLCILLLKAKQQHVAMLSMES